MVTGITDPTHGSHNLEEKVRGITVLFPTIMSSGKDFQTEINTFIWARMDNLFLGLQKKQLFELTIN